MSDREDGVNHPRHYNARGPIEDDGTAKFEPIKVIEAWDLGPEFCVGNALKYIARAHHKGNPIEDLKKAKWYLSRVRSNDRNTRLVIPESKDGMSWKDVANGWGLKGHLRNALLNVWHGCMTSAAGFVQKEIDRLTGGDIRQCPDLSGLAAREAAILKPKGSG